MIWSLEKNLHLQFIKFWGIKSHLIAAFGMRRLPKNEGKELVVVFYQKKTIGK